MKYTDEEIQEKILPYGYYLIENKDVKNIFAIDSDGYKYKLTLSNLLMGKKPHWIMKNPFALENIKLYLSINYPDFELLDDEYISCKSKMAFICHKHPEKGIQYKNLDNIVNNDHACIYCGYENLSLAKRLPEKELIKLCEDKNMIYVGRFSKNRETYIQYKCPNHLDNGIQEMSLTHFKYSRNPCRFCTVSSGELKVSQILNKYNINYIPQKTFEECKYINNLRFDFYLPNYHTCIEFDGKQHFEMMKYADSDEKNVEIFKLNQIRDKIKDDYCKNKNMKLIRIPYWEYDNIETILASELPDAFLMCKNTESSETAG